MPKLFQPLVWVQVFVSVYVYTRSLELPIEFKICVQNKTYLCHVKDISSLFLLK